MHKLMLSIAGIALVFVATTMDAQAKGGAVSGWSTGAAAAPGSGAAAGAGASGPSTSGSASASSPLNGGSFSTGTTKSGTYQAGTVHGYVAGAPNVGSGPNSPAVPASTGLQLNANGTLSHGLAAGSMSSGPGVSLVGQSRISGPMLGIGNSEIFQGSAGVGNSQASLTAAIGAAAAGNAVLGSFKNGSPATATNIMSRFDSATLKAQGTTAATSPQTSMGPPVVKACAAQSGNSSACN